MEEVGSSETLIILYQTTQSHIPEDLTVNLQEDSHGVKYEEQPPLFLYKYAFSHSFL